jgi:phage tail sheath gpL-like
MSLFNAIPGNVLVPFFYAEINSGGSPYQGQARQLLIGQKLAGGTAPANVPVGPIGSEREAIALFGLGSMLVEQYKIARRGDPFGVAPIWALPLADPAGVAASGTLTVDQAPGVAGVAVVSVYGVRLTVQVLASDTANTVAAAVAAAINASAVPVTAGAAGAVVTVTSRHVGVVGNGIELRLRSDEPNVLVGKATIVAMAGGTGVPSLTTALANCGDDEFDWITGPYSDATSLNAIRDFLADTSTGRWSPTKMLYGHYISQVVGNLATCVTLGNGRNDRHVTILGTQAAPEPGYLWGASLNAIAASHLSDAPELSRPLQTLELPGIQPPVDRSTWWNQQDRQALYADGIAACKVTIDGRVVVDRAVTTEQLNAAGVPDATFRDIETIAQMMFVARYFRAGVSSRFARMALADENPAGLDTIVTPLDIRNWLIHLYEELVALGVLEKANLFAQFLKVERDPNDATRVNAYLPVDVVNHLRVFAANITTFLQYRQ